MADQVDLAEYLFTRLRQLGIQSIHGVPGDYNLVALDYIEPAGLHWVGNANELNAGYAADGYARVKGAGALITAFGVGELSAINAIGGAYAELVPVVHIVGTPSTALQGNRVCLHHSLGDGNFRVFAEMSAKITVAQANLVDLATAPAEIDRCLRECVLQSRPVYIELPTNMVSAKVPALRLSSPIDTSIPVSDEGFDDAEVDEILDRMYASRQPFIIVDGFTNRYGISEEADELVRVTGFPTSTTPSGKGIVNESYPNFHGIYAGTAGKQVYMPWAESCDLILRLGPLNSDANTYGFTTIPDPSKTITFYRDFVELGSTKYSNLHVKSLLRRILDRVDRAKLPKYDPYPDLGVPSAQLEALAPPQPDAAIDQDTFWLRMSNFLRPGDVVLTETGTPFAGGRDLILPPHTRLINSAMWLSIGYMLPAAAGAALALRDQKAGGGGGGGGGSGRTILFEGDGSLQMTAQAISDMIRNRLDVVIFIINNDGYTIERWVHGMNAGYNDVQPWRYLQAASYFGAPLDDPDYPVTTRTARNWADMEAVLDGDDSAVRDAKGLVLVEVFMDKYDAPDPLKKLVEGAARRNSSSTTSARG